MKEKPDFFARLWDFARGEDIKAEYSAKIQAVKDQIQVAKEQKTSVPPNVNKDVLQNDLPIKAAGCEVSEDHVEVTEIFKT